MITLKHTILARWPALQGLGRTARFGLVGLSGVLVNSAVLWVLVVQAGLPLLVASALATEVAVLSNFLLNDRWTFRTRQHGSVWQRFARFNGVALGGMLITMVLVALLAGYGLPLLGANLLAVGGALVWNYIINSRWTWRAPTVPQVQHVGNVAMLKSLMSQRPFTSFLGVGLLGVLVNTVALVLLRERFGLPLVVAALLAGGVAAVHNYALHHVWTFQHGKVRLRHVLLFHATALATLILSALFLMGIIRATGMAYALANVLAVLVASALNYLLVARWVWPSLPLRRVSRLVALRSVAQERAGMLVSHAGTLKYIITSAAVVLALAWIAWAQPGAAVVLAVLLLGAALVARPGIASQRAVVLVMATAVGISALNYLTWRLEVLNWWAWWIAVPLFIAELFGALHALGLQYTVWPRDEPQSILTEDPTRRPIYVFIPTVNEGKIVLEPTLRGVLAARAQYLAQYTHGHVTIVLCNDGRVANAPNWQEAEVLAAHMGVVCITRTVKGGAKAGNIEHARQQVGATGDALIVIFDADQIASPDFFLKTVPPFGDPQVGWVQTGQYYTNLGNPVAHWSNDQQALFYQVLCPGKAVQNAAFICGTNVVLRATALDEIGGLPQDSVTEDFAASIALHDRWRSIFLTDVLARGLGPMDLKSYFKQQQRWAIGTLGVLRTHWRDILLPGRNRLKANQRLQYALACTHYLSGVRDLIYLVAPLVFLFTGIPAVRGTDLQAFLWHFLPYFAISQIAFWRIAWGKTSLRSIIIGFGCFPVLIGSLLTVITGKRVGFAVTSKQRGESSVWSTLAPHMLGAAACLGGLGMIVWRGGVQAPIVVSALWVVYTLLMLSGMFWLAYADQRAARDARLAMERVTRQIRLHEPQRPRLVIKPAVAGISAIALAGIFAATTMQSWAHPTSFAPAAETGRPYFGVSLPTELLATQPPKLEQQLGVTFAMVGRTQVVDDTFDQAWATQLAARHERPWITLLFGVSGQPTMESSLPAIANGVHDEALQRWARDIRAYGKPVYLTILPHVDRNWSLSSAVTNGGIPADVPRAWQHVQAVFNAEGTSNVAWVWAPADPANDAAYAPPRATIAATLISIINYPNTQWSDPAMVLDAVAARYPDMPLLVEVSAAGDAAQKAAWLHSVGTAVAARSHMHALLYHEGAPDPHASAAENAAWSMASDAQALHAMHDAAVATQVQTAAGE